MCILSLRCLWVFTNGLVDWACCFLFFFFFFNDTATTEIYPLSLHALFRSNLGRALPGCNRLPAGAVRGGGALDSIRSEEHTSELQSRSDLVCRLLLEKK